MDARVLETHDKDAIRGEVTNYIMGMKARSVRFVFAPYHSLSTNIYYESCCYALEVYREHSVVEWQAQPHRLTMISWKGTATVSGSRRCHDTP